MYDHMRTMGHKYLAVMKSEICSNNMREQKEGGSIETESIKNIFYGKFPF